MLADPWRRRGSDKPGVPPESGEVFRALFAGAAAKMREVSSSDSEDGGESGAFIAQECEGLFVHGGVATPRRGPRGSVCACQYLSPV